MPEPAIAIENYEKDLNEMILAGKIMEGYEAFYSDDVAMQENADPPCVGKDENRKRQYQFFGMVKELHSATLVGGAVSENRAYSEWDYDISFKDGFRFRLAQVAVRQWKGGKVVHERYYWDRKNYPYEV